MPIGSPSRTGTRSLRGAIVDNSSTAEPTTPRETVGGAPDHTVGHVNTGTGTATSPPETGADGRGRPAVSVVIACYNGEDTLGVQLDALARQLDAPAFEVVLADNGSTDGSADLARSYTDRLDLRVVDASDVKGPAHARNIGVGAARARYIAFCDADDEVADDWVRQAHTALDSGEHEFIAGRVDIEKLNSAATRRSRQMVQQEGLQESGVGVGLKHAGAGNMAFHREAFEQVGGFDEALRCLQDSDLCWRMQLAGTRLDYVRDLVIYTRLRSTVRDMCRQAYLYGRSFAQLEGRYGVERQDSPDDRHGPVPAAGPSARAGHVDTLVRRARRVRDLGLGGTAWQVAWHVGHQVGKRGVRRHPVHIQSHQPV